MATDDQAVLYRQDDHVVTLTLNLPELRNPVSEQSVIEGLVAAMERMNADKSVRAAILTGAGSAFSSGGNLKAMAAPGGNADAPPIENRLWYVDGIQRIPLAFERLEVPIVAAVNGPAIGAGCDVACMCDIRVAGKSATFAESFVKVGLIPGDGGVWLLPRAIGQSRARELAFTGDAISSDTALEWGLVSYVVDDDQLMDKARSIAQRIAANPPAAVRMTKKLMTAGQDMTLDRVLDMSAAMQPLAHATRDHREALDAFVAKRKPNFTGN
ncbi:enoyl-CoA hydratase/carnithine racemase [Sphingobium xenophagum]|uniref:Enoyl-CoA hydratase/carnithine racemase n=1 Tax=Sphingobium xenophagum TaxID=121428 RepID=A0ABU1X4F0_SPHXE|nr:crotonase/enoyl-CoA hydratase family protein [Sphingobium xenophagum]MDR7156431.1 enoyl-CoA hydratase/carnithine racemase [Sphingobium xenophagum]